MDTVVTKQQKIVFRVSRMVYEIDLPRGLRVKPVPHSRDGEYFLDEFPAALFPLNSFVRHDAEHYGIRLNSGEVSKICPDCQVPRDLDETGGMFFPLPELDKLYTMTKSSTGIGN